MIRSLWIRVAVLLVLVTALFSGTAHAYQGSTFRLRIEDPVTGQGRIITDQWTNGFGNGNGDENSTPGVIYFSGYLENPQWFIQVLTTSSTLNTDGSGGGVLTLAARVSYTGSATNAQIVLTLEDTGYFPTPVTPFVGVIGGYNYATKTVTQAGDLAAGGTINMQSWLNTANTDPYFGANSGQLATNPNYSQVVNGPDMLNGSDTSIAALVASGNTGTAFAGSEGAFSNTGSSTSTFSDTSAGVGVNFGTNYSVFSQAALTFNGSGSTDFSITASNPSTSVPEPTPLLLLGSGLLGLGVLRRKLI